MGKTEHFIKQTYTVLVLWSKQLKIYLLFLSVAYEILANEMVIQHPTVLIPTSIYIKNMERE